MNRRGRAIATLLVAAATVALAGCDVVRQLIPEPPRESQEQAFGPDFPPEPPSGERRRVETASLSLDRRLVTVTFTGSEGYLPSDPCSEDYLPWVGLVGIDLGVTVVGVRHPGDAVVGEGEGCTLEGYIYTFHLRLHQPWNGFIVRDLESGIELINER